MLIICAKNKIQKKKKKKKKKKEEKVRDELHSQSSHEDEEGAKMPPWPCVLHLTLQSPQPM